MVRCKNLSTQQEQELRSKKQQADALWDNLIERIILDGSVTRQEVTLKMDMCNLADTALMMRGYSF